MIDGRWILRGGRVLTVDEARLRDQAAESAARLTEATRERREIARQLEPYVGAFCRAQAGAPHAVQRLASTP